MDTGYKAAYAVQRIVLSNGCELAYIDEGQGEQTILFVHGLATYSQSWRKNIDALKQRYRCIAIDLPGNGLSQRGSYSYDVPFFAATVIDFIGRMGLHNLCLAGHSMGGQIAMTAVLQAPECAAKLLLCAPAGFETFSPWERELYQSTISFFDMFSSEENSLRKTIRSSFFNYPHQADEMIEELIGLKQRYPNSAYRQMIESCIQGMLRNPVFDRLHEIQQPTLVLYGERDALIPNRILHPVTTRQVAMAGVSRMPHAELEMVPQCGHFLQIEKAAAVNKLISSWLG